MWVITDSWGFIWTLATSLSRTWPPPGLSISNSWTLVRLELVAGVPFVDTLTSMLDASLPLTVTEYDEWGDPAGDAGAYADIAAYAPYENVEAKRYPPILAMTSLNDTRVLYVEPAKWVAALRHTQPEGAPAVLLKTEMNAGHGGISGRYERWKETAFQYAWLLDVTKADSGDG